NRLVDLADQLQQAPETPEERFGAFMGWWESMLLGEGWGPVIFEFVGATRDNAELHEQLAARERMVIDYCAELIEAEVERFGLTPALTPLELAGMLTALGQGLAFTRRLDPRVEAHILTKTAWPLQCRPGREPSV